MFRFCKATGLIRYSGDQIEKNEMRGSCSTYEGDDNVHKVFWWGNLMKGDHLENPDVDGRIILR